MSEPQKLKTDFVHLHVHSMYSLLSAVPTPKELAKTAKADGQDALAITDAGALYGAIDFYKACTAEEIKPIIGLDAFLAPRTRFDKEVHIDKPRSRLVLLAKTFAGYQISLSSSQNQTLKGSITDPGLMTNSLKNYTKILSALSPLLPERLHKH